MNDIEDLEKIVQAVKGEAREDLHPHRSSFPDLDAHASALASESVIIIQRPAKLP